MVRIICVGNRFAYPDNFGMVVYEALKEKELEGIELVEGGVGGMSLLPYFEDDAQILIVDYATLDMPKTATKEDIAKLPVCEYNHATSFLYMLKSIEKDYTLYLCSKAYEKTEIPHYVDEILTLARELG